MDKDKNKGLADTQEGEFILNESGTSISIDADLPEEENQPDDAEQANKNTEPAPEDTKDE